MAYYQSGDGSVYQTQCGKWADSHIKLSEVEGKRAYIQTKAAELKQWIKPGQTVYTNVNHVSRSGMLRNISAYIVTDGRIACIDWYVSIVTGRSKAKDGSIKCHGCGMDMGFDLVYSLGHALWPNGTETPHGTRNGEPDTCGGYALKQSAL
jgi:hypothetical protein